MSQSSCGARDRVEQIDAVRTAVRHIYIADTLARQTQRLRPGIADDGVFVDVRDERHLYAVKHELAVRLVGDQIDRVTELFAHSPERRGERFERFLPINDARGIVRRIDDDRLRMLRIIRLDLLNVQIEVGRVRGNDDDLAILTSKMIETAH